LDVKLAQLIASPMMMNNITILVLVQEAEVTVAATQEEDVPGRTSLTANARHTSRGFELKKIVKCKRKVGR